MMQYDFHTGKAVPTATMPAGLAPSPEGAVPAAAPGPEGIQLFAALNTNVTVATCPQFDPASLRWNVSALAYGEGGKQAGARRAATCCWCAAGAGQGAARPAMPSLLCQHGSS